jgi:hypothetical protein
VALALALSVAGTLCAGEPAGGSGADSTAATGAAVKPGAAAPALPGKPAGPGPTARASRLRVKKMILGIRHRAFPDFYDQVTVRMGESFPIGDTRYTAKVLRFVPDFGIDLKTRQVFSKSDEPTNPAMHVATWEGEAPHDTSWAFLNFPPHFSKRALLAFQLLRVEFENHAPATISVLPSFDTTKTGGKKR